jgi:hypothetical protein
VASYYREQNRADKRISSPCTFFLSRHVGAALAFRCFGSLTKRRLLDPIGGRGRENAFGTSRGAARRYCLGQGAIYPSSCAACSGQ